jgi:hypothetical protein
MRSKRNTMGKKELLTISIGLAMILAGCTELMPDDEEDENSETYTAQDLNGTYFAEMFSIRAEVANDNSIQLHILALLDCYDDIATAQTEADTYNSSGEEGTAVVLENACLYIERPMASEELTSVELVEHQGTMVIEAVIGNPAQDEGYELVLSPDGYGAIEFSFDGLEICVGMQPNFDINIAEQVVEAMVEYENNGGEITEDNIDDLPESITSLYAEYQQNFANSMIPNIAEGCNGTYYGNFLYLYIWASSMASDEIEGESTLYRFDGVDADETTTAETDDVLVKVTYESGKDIDWSRISIRIYVNEDAPHTCDNPNQNDSNICKIIDTSEDDPEVLNVGEVFQIVENDYDLCHQESECTLEVTIVDAYEGVSLSSFTLLVE